MLGNMIDLHSHSTNSPDGADTVEVMCNRAVELGLAAYAITDHFESNYECDNSPFADGTDWNNKEYKPFENIKRLCEDIKSYKQGNNSNTKILFGIEIGQPLQDEDKAIAILDQFKSELDFVLMSLHCVENQPDFYYIDYQNKSQEYLDRLCESYYEEMYRMVQTDYYDSIGHLTYPVRYAANHSEEQGRRIRLHLQDDRITKILKTVIAKGKGIEINTSGLRNRMNECMVNERYLKLYKSLGGEILTVGSDSHKVGDLGSGIKQGMQLAKQCGFRYITYFEKRKAVYLPI